MNYDYAIIGGGIVGLSTGIHLLRDRSGLRVVVLEKEGGLAEHQTGRNSGVIHSGIYYKPGSYKARFARAGATSMVRFCEEHGIKHDVCGKVIVATRKDEMPRMEKLYERGLENGLDVSRLDSEQVAEVEPHVRSFGGIRVPSTGIVDYSDVSQKYADLIKERGGEIRTGAKLLHAHNRDGGVVLETSVGEFETKTVVNCAGLHCDRIAKLLGHTPEARIVPFRGEYFELVPEKRSLVKSLIYPVPNPAFPFLGVHFTRMIDGTVHAGPNAVLAFKREGYHKTDFSARDMIDTFTFTGFWKLAAKHYKDGAMEMVRSLSKKAFVRSLQELIPEIEEDDVVPTHAGVRAQALLPTGEPVDDFLFARSENCLHVLNAPSPAATASLEIGQRIADELLSE